MIEVWLYCVRRIPDSEREDGIGYDQASDQDQWYVYLVGLPPGPRKYAPSRIMKMGEPYLGDFEHRDPEGWPYGVMLAHYEGDGEGARNYVRTTRISLGLPNTIICEGLDFFRFGMTRKPEPYGPTLYDRLLSDD